MLSVRDLKVSVDPVRGGASNGVEGKEILHGVSLDVADGEIVALMGPNGSGKSTLAYAIAGHPRYHVTAGAVTWQAPSSNSQAPTDVLSLKPDERARLGIFLSFQYPTEIPGVPFVQMLRTAVGQKAGALPPVRDFLKVLDEKLQLLHMDPAIAERNVNEGFSGGEKKRAEILQLAVLEPQLAILDETDSGLDVDALRTVAEGIKAVRGQTSTERGLTPRAPMSVLLITHYERFLEFLTPDRVLIMKDGRIVAEGDKALADRIQREGYSPMGN
jgi:Fe-S cluster assembly ATP-binding protein